MTMGSGYSSAGFSLSSATLSRDPAGKKVATLFKPSDHTLYVNVVLSGPGMGAKVRVVWAQVSESFLPGRVLSDQVAVVDGDNNGIHVKGTYSQDWPTGTYKTDIYLNGSSERTLDWSVR